MTSELIKKEKIIFEGVKYLRENFYKSDLKIKEASDKCFISQAYFRKIFNEVYNISPIKYLNKIRLDKAGELLYNGNCLVKQVCQKCGFNSPCRFSREFKKYYGVTPSAYNKQDVFEM